MAMEKIHNIIQDVVNETQRFREDYIRKESIKAIEKGYKYICFFESSPSFQQDGDKCTASLNITCSFYNDKFEEDLFGLMSNRFHQVYTLDLTDENVLAIIYNKRGLSL